MRVTVLLFASVAEAAGTDRVDLELDDGDSLAALRDRLHGRWPALARIPYVFAVNRDYAKDSRVLAGGDEVALVPAISGGAGPLRCDFAFCRDAIDPRALEARARRDEDGAVVTFLGVTRNRDGGRAVARLAYEAFEAMASAKILAILEDVAAALPLGRIVVRHRLGEVPVGAASIAVVVAAPHREAAFEAARRTMDRIKAEAPIFKKEVTADGGARWVGDLPRAGE